MNKQEQWRIEALDKWSETPLDNANDFIEGYLAGRKNGDVEQRVKNKKARKALAKIEALHGNADWCGYDSEFETIKSALESE